MTSSSQILPSSQNLQGNPQDEKGEIRVLVKANGEEIPVRILSELPTATATQTLNEQAENSCFLTRNLLTNEICYLKYSRRSKLICEFLALESIRPFIPQQPVTRFMTDTKTEKLCILFAKKGDGNYFSDTERHPYTVIQEKILDGQIKGVAKIAILQLFQCNTKFSLKNMLFYKDDVTEETCALGINLESCFASSFATSTSTPRSFEIDVASLESSPLVSPLLVAGVGYLEEFLYNIENSEYQAAIVPKAELFLPTERSATLLQILMMRELQEILYQELYKTQIAPHFKKEKDEIKNHSKHLVDLIIQGQEKRYLHFLEKASSWKEFVDYLKGKYAKKDREEFCSQIEAHRIPDEKNPLRSSDEIIRMIKDAWNNLWESTISQDKLIQMEIHAVQQQKLLIEQQKLLAEQVVQQKLSPDSKQTKQVREFAVEGTRLVAQQQNLILNQRLVKRLATHQQSSSREPSEEKPNILDEEKNRGGGNVVVRVNQPQQEQPAGNRESWLDCFATLFSCKGNGCCDDCCTGCCTGAPENQEVLGPPLPPTPTPPYVNK